VPGWLTDYGVTASMFEVTHNDRPNSGAWIYSRLDSLWNICHAYNPTMPVIFSEVPPDSGDTAGEGSPTMLQSYAQIKLNNTEIFRECIFRQCYFAPMYLRFMNHTPDKGSLIYAPLSSDGIHMSTAGQLAQAKALSKAYVPGSVSTCSFGTDSTRDPWSAWVTGAGVSITGDTLTGAMTFAAINDTAYSPVFHFNPFSNRLTFKTQMTSGTTKKLWRSGQYDFSRVASTAWASASTDTISTSDSWIQIALVSNNAAVLDSLVIFDTLQKSSNAEITKYFGNRPGMEPIGFRDLYLNKYYGNAIGYQDELDLWDRHTISATSYNSYVFIDGGMINYIPTGAIIDSAKLVLFVYSGYNRVASSAKIIAHRLTHSWGWFSSWCEYSVNYTLNPSINNANDGGGVYPVIPWANSDTFNFAENCSGKDSVTVLSSQTDSIIINISGISKLGLTQGVALELNGTANDLLLFYSQQTTDQTKRPYFIVSYKTAAASSAGGGRHGWGWWKWW